MFQYVTNLLDLIGPIAELKGKEHVVKAIKGFTMAFEELNVRKMFEDGNQAMLKIDAEFPKPMGHLRTASLLTIEEGLIKEIELFYDSRIIESKKDDVFAN